MQSWDMYLEYIETRLNSISLDILYELTSDEYTINNSIN